MLHIAGAARFSFTFPADPKTAFQYYSDLRRLVLHLPHIELMRAGPDGFYRMRYESLEMGTYRITILCDVRLVADPRDGTISLVPLKRPEIDPLATRNATMGWGEYSSQARFIGAGDSTRIDYTLRLSSKLPAPTSMRLMPGKVAHKLARNITRRRIREIAQGFIQNSVSAFPLWQEANSRENGTLPGSRSVDPPAGDGGGPRTGPGLNPLMIGS